MTLQQSIKLGAVAAPKGARMSLVALLSIMFVTLHHPDFFPLRPQQPGGMDGRGRSLRPGCGPCCGVRPSFSAKRRRFASTSSIRTSRNDCGAFSQSSPASPLVFLYGISLPADLQVCQLHEGRALGLSSRADRLDVFGLRHLRSGLHRALLLAGLSRHSRRRITENRSSEGDRLTMPISPVRALHHRHSRSSARSACRSAIR